MFHGVIVETRHGASLLDGIIPFYETRQARLYLPRICDIVFPDLIRCSSNPWIGRALSEHWASIGRSRERV